MATSTGMDRSPEPPFPVTSRYPLEVKPAARRRIRALADRLLARDPSLPRTDLCGPGVAAGFVPGAPVLHLHDLLGAAAAPGHPDLTLEHRAFALARSGDLVLTSSPPASGFLEYRRSALGLGEAEALSPSLPPDGISLVQRCLRDPRCLGRLVAAAPPLLTRRANDKLWFSRVVEELLGPAAEPPTFRVHGLTRLTERVWALCRGAGRIAIKLPRGASGLGNVVLDAAGLRAGSLSEVRSRLARLLREHGWAGRFPLLLSVWEQPEDAAIHWVECNGRWGGTSIPMTLADRLVGDWRRAPFVVVHREPAPAEPRVFDAALRALGGRLFQAGGEAGVVLLSSRGIEEGSSLDLMALAPGVDGALREAEEAARLLAPASGGTRAA